MSSPAPPAPDPIARRGTVPPTRDRRNTIDTAAHVVAFFRALHGTWNGRGEGTYPTLPDFTYAETTRFEFADAYPLVHFEQRTWLEPDHEPAHWESGIIRPNDDGHVEMSNAQDGGRIEVLRGALEVDGAVFRLPMTHVVFAHDSRLVSTERRFTLDGDTLTYEVLMATHTTEAPEHQRHLVATLARTSDG